MRLRNEYTLTDMPGEQQIAVPLDGGKNFHGIIRLNESGAEVFRGLTEGEDEEQLVQRLMNKYDGLDRATAEKAVNAVIQKFRDANLLDE